MIPDETIQQLMRNQLPVEMEASLLARQKAPDNHECPVHQWWSWLTPNRLFYVRSHFPVPALDAAAWRLQIDGEVEAPLSLSLTDLRSLPRHRLVVTLECAGNRRTEFEPCPPGVPWQDGAVSTAEWEGVSLAEVLSLARPRSSGRELLLEGADRGSVAGQSGAIPFARSLAIQQALHPDALLADRMNGEPLPPDHGAPLRALIPGAYGMDSVKWLVRLSVLDRPFDGHFQVNDYQLFPPPGSAEPSRPLGPIRVSSLITWPADGQELRAGQPVQISGYAWSGRGAVRQVELSTDGGTTWQAVELVGPSAPYAWRIWQLAWTPPAPGRYSLKVKATDESGASQPEQVEWNVRGYANHCRYHIEVTAR